MNLFCLPREEVVKENDSHIIPDYLSWKPCMGKTTFCYMFKSNHHSIAKKDFIVNHENQGFSKLKPQEYRFTAYWFWTNKLPDNWTG